MPQTVSDTRAILADYVWNGRPDGAAHPAFISYSFELAAPAYIPAYDDYSDAFRASFRPLGAQQQATARAAFSVWDQASGIRFFEVPSGMGGIKLAVYDLARDSELEDADGVFTGRFRPGGYAPKTIIMADDDSDPADSTLYLHEIGHALGLKHPFDGDFVLPERLDRGAVTVMSYTFDGTPGLGWLDREAIVQLYGDPSRDGSMTASWSWDQARSTLSQVGGTGDDRLVGVGGFNVIDGGGGDDVLEGADLHDILRGGAGADALYGFDGNDHLYGQSANGGEDGRDTLYGGEGSDYLQGNSGDDLLDGGGGSDRIYGGQGNDSIVGGLGHDSVNGNLGDDTIDGGSGNDWLRGGRGNDRLSAGTAASADAEDNDVLMGDDGDDTLIASSGSDRLTGGPGSDVFTWALTGYAYGGAPARITDFEDGRDRFDMQQRVTQLDRGSADGEQAALQLARSRGWTDDAHVAAIQVGSDTYLFGRFGSLLVERTQAAAIDLGDFV